MATSGVALETGPHGEADLRVLLERTLVTPAQRHAAAVDELTAGAHALGVVARVGGVDGQAQLVVRVEPHRQPEPDAEQHRHREIAGGLLRGYRRIVAVAA